MWLSWPPSSLPASARSGSACWLSRVVRMRSYTHHCLDYWHGTARHSTARRGSSRDCWCFQTVSWIPHEHACTLVTVAGNHSLRRKYSKGCADLAGWGRCCGRCTWTTRTSMTSWCAPSPCRPTIPTRQRSSTASSPGGAVLAPPSMSSSASCRYCCCCPDHVPGGQALWHCAGSVCWADGGCNLAAPLPVCVIVSCIRNAAHGNGRDASASTCLLYPMSQTGY